MSGVPDDDETIRVRASRTQPAPGLDVESEIDETTEVSLRRASRRAVAPPQLDEATRLSHRRSSERTTPGPDEATQAMHRRGSEGSAAPESPIESGANESGANVPGAAGVADAPEAADAASGRRRSTYIESVPAAEDVADGSTIVAHRESRRRAAREADLPGSAPAPGIPGAASAAPAGPAIIGDGRIASSPVGTREVFGVRRAEPLVVERTSPPPRARQAPQDVDAADARTRRADRRATIVVVSTASAVVVAAAAALIAIVLAL